jgi:hypothetical protein
VLLPHNLSSSEDVGEGDVGPSLPESISITRIDDLLSQMRFHEVPKRAQFSVGFELGKGWVIGVKGYVSFFFVGLVEFFAAISVCPFDEGEAVNGEWERD